MNYPLISEYVEAIKLAEDNFEELSYLRPVLDAEGQPVMSSGNFAVVFKMKDERDGKQYAVKCFLKEQEGRAESYKLIAEELEFVSSNYLTPIIYLEKELFVDTKNSDENEFPVLLMDWVEGKTLDKYLRENLGDKYALETLAYRFSQLAQWLIPQPFAHGDLKPDNILVREDGTLVLVDYDGMYVPAMKGQKARELGSPDFRHPSRTEGDFDEHIDDFSLVTILLSLKTISVNPALLEEYGVTDRLLFSEKDYRSLSECEKIPKLLELNDLDINRLLGLLLLAYTEGNLSNVSFKLLNVVKPNIGKCQNVYGHFTDIRDGYTYKTIKIGNQIWLAENLRYLPSNNSGFYVYGYDGNDVIQAKQSRYYEDFGVLYDMNAAQIACPSGWHIPSDDEWKILESNIGMSTEEIDYINIYRGKGLGSALLDRSIKCKKGALSEMKRSDLNFNARLGGWRTYHRKYESVAELCKWWSSSIHVRTSCPGAYYYRVLSYEESGIGRGSCSKQCCLSLRCIKDG